MTGQALDKVERRVHGIRTEGIHTRPHDELAPARLTDIDVQTARYDDDVQEWLERFGHTRLKGGGGDGEFETGHGGDGRPPSGRGVEDGFGGDVASGGFYAPDLPVADVDSGNFGLLMDVDAPPVGVVGEAPDDGVVTDDPTRRMLQGGHDGVAGVLAQVEADLVGAEADRFDDPFTQPELGGDVHGEGEGGRTVSRVQ